MFSWDRIFLLELTNKLGHPRDPPVSGSSALELKACYHIQLSMCVHMRVYVCMCVRVY